VTSVGTGALILGAAGLLQGVHATTHPAYHRILEHLGARYIRDRWVEHGKFVTAGGTSGGIDMALQLVARHKDKRAARQVQLWIEYDPQPPFGPLDQPATDEDSLAPLLAAHEADWRRALAHRPDLLDAVRRAAYPVAPSGINR
jgi:transcriptional regulator GlxA family with amidase domain